MHHSSKGNQSGKSITDVSAGAGSQSRATDTHLVLRPHEEKDVVVLDATVRSWPPIEPRCLRWTFPVWTPDDTLDPADLFSVRARRCKSRARARAQTEKPEWTAEQFATAFVTAEQAELIHRWTFGVTKPVQFATESKTAGSSLRVRTPPRPCAYARPG
jgi:hypothetical protein